MSNEKAPNISDAQGDVTSKMNVYSRLLGMATQAAEGHLTDHPEPMSGSDRAFLENALKEAASQPNSGFVDPLEIVKLLLNQLRQLSGSPYDYDKLAAIIEQLIDQICDMDLALDFCKLGGLEIIHSYLQVPSTSSSTIAKNPQPDIAQIHTLFVWLLAELAQQNPKVQELVIKEDEYGFLNHCLNDISNPQLSESYKMKCVGAVSAMVKGYLPGFVKFIRLRGTDHFRTAFNQAVDKDETRLITRLTIVVTNISRSFGDSRISKDVRLVELFNQMNNRLVELSSGQNSDNKYSEALDYMQASV